MSPEPILLLQSCCSHPFAVKAPYPIVAEEQVSRQSSYCGPNHSTPFPFHASTISCHPLAHVRCSNTLPSAYATFYDISVPLTANYEDTSRCFNIIRQISKGTREGAIRGLVGIGKEVVKKGLVEGGGVGSECMPGETGPLVDSVMVSISSNASQLRIVRGSHPFHVPPGI